MSGLDQPQKNPETITSSNSKMNVSSSDQEHVLAIKPPQPKIEQKTVENDNKCNNSQTENVKQNDTEHQTINIAISEATLSESTFADENICIDIDGTQVQSSHEHIQMNTIDNVELNEQEEEISLLDNTNDVLFTSASTGWSNRILPSI